MKIRNIQLNEESRMNKKIKEYIKNRGWTVPTEKEIKRSVPPGRQQDARDGKVWIGRDSVYGGKMWYSVSDVERFILIDKELESAKLMQELKGI